MIFTWWPPLRPPSVSCQLCACYCSVRLPCPARVTTGHAAGGLMEKPTGFTALRLSPLLFRPWTEAVHDKLTDIIVRCQTASQRPQELAATFVKLQEFFFSVKTEFLSKVCQFFQIVKTLTVLKLSCLLWHSKSLWKFSWKYLYVYH